MGVPIKMLLSDIITNFVPVRFHFIDSRGSLDSLITLTAVASHCMSFVPELDTSILQIITCFGGVFFVFYDGYDESAGLQILDRVHMLL